MGMDQEELICEGTRLVRITYVMAVLTSLTTSGTPTMLTVQQTPSMLSTSLKLKLQRVVHQCWLPECDHYHDKLQQMSDYVKRWLLKLCSHKARTLSLQVWSH
jgi:hypothetical protein